MTLGRIGRKQHLLPVALVILGPLHLGGQGSFGTTRHDTLFLALSGPITALPMILFSVAARRIPMATVGLLQYINPTLQFLCAVVVLGEVLTLWHGIAFGLIWTALALYSASAYGQDRTSRKAVIAASGDVTGIR